MRRAQLKTLLASIALVGGSVMAAPAMAGQGNWLKNGHWFVEGSFGSGQYGPDQAEVNRKLGERGHNVTVGLDRIDSAWAVRGGFQSNCCWGFELGYYDLGDVETTVNGTAADPARLANDLAELQPYGIQAVALLGTFAFSQSPNPHGLHIVGKLGPAWTMGEVNLSSGSGAFRINREFDELRVAAGIGFRWDVLKDFSVSGEYLRFDLENQRTADFIGASLRYRFKL